MSPSINAIPVHQAEGDEAGGASWDHNVGTAQLDVLDGSAVDERNYCVQAQGFLHDVGGVRHFLGVLGLHVRSIPEDGLDLVLDLPLDLGEVARKEVRHVATEEGCGVVPCRKKSGELYISFLLSFMSSMPLRGSSFSGVVFFSLRSFSLF